MYMFKSETDVYIAAITVTFVTPTATSLAPITYWYYNQTYPVTITATPGFSTFETVRVYLINNQTQQSTLVATAKGNAINALTGLNAPIPQRSLTLPPGLYQLQLEWSHNSFPELPSIVKTSRANITLSRKLKNNVAFTDNTQQHKHTNANSNK